ncbi:transposase [Mucilaginibacter sp. JRF]|uniref:transposase n=1 Tax=Mucilaginibacter sp. JRF TaxID=2780088 RepID=UPI001880DA0E|nr:transposase [Mucilaginibacter sp. JRF]MBE9584623.1 transposase [Mucilaginibacter sp. JRF]
MVIKDKKFTYFIGIDVSRNELDFAVLHSGKFVLHKEVSNSTDAIALVVSELKLLPRLMISRTVFCMENTGLYCNHILTTLKKFKAHIVQENALHIRNSLGNIRGKYDKIDAIRIAQYAYKNRDELKLWTPRRKEIQQLAHLTSLRFRLIGLQSALKTPLNEQRSFVNKGVLSESILLCKRSLDAVKLDIENVDLRILELIKKDEKLNRLHSIITSVPCIGTVTAVQVIIRTNEFLDIRTAKKFACYAGVAPFRKESGLVTQKARVSQIANKKVKALLHICALGAMRFDPEIKAYYVRKVDEGKPKMSVVNAVRFKLINRIFTCVNQDRLFEKEYKKGQLLLAHL